VANHVQDVNELARRANFKLQRLYNISCEETEMFSSVASLGTVVLDLLLGGHVKLRDTSVNSTTF